MYVDVCVCKIKWQAECNASTNTGASGRMKGAVMTAHRGKEEKIHPSTLLFPAFILSSLSHCICFWIYKKKAATSFHTQDSAEHF